MNITKADIVNAVATKTGLTKIEIKKVIDETFETIIHSVSEGKRIELRGFGVFKSKKRKARMARNPKTGIAVELKERNVPVFKASPDFNRKVKGEIS